MQRWLFLAAGIQQCDSKLKLLSLLSKMIILMPTDNTVVGFATVIWVSVLFAYHYKFYSGLCVMVSVAVAMGCFRECSARTSSHASS